MELKHFINGVDYQGNSDTVFNILNPSDGELLHTIKGADKNDTKKAIQVAKETFNTWKEVTATSRAQIMFKYRDLILSNLDKIVELICLERGKTIADAKGEILRGLEVVEYCTGIVGHLGSNFTSRVTKDIDVYNFRSPLGVCAGITPFNFPAMVPMWMFPIAIACGNTFVLKLSEKVPTAGLLLTKLLHEAGLPKGVLNTIIGDKEVVDELLINPDIEAISFVGSTKVGEYVYNTGCGHNKKVQALCGAKNHMIVMPDLMEDKFLDQAVNAALGAVYGSSGERCMAVSVIVAVGDQVADKMIAKLKPKIENLKIGKFTQGESIEFGPVISQESKDRFFKYVEEGKQAGAKLVVDGSKYLPAELNDKGFFIGGYLFDKVTTDMSIYLDEIFGPIVCVVRVQTYEEALALLDNHQYANGSAIFTRDGDTARDFSLRTPSGMVGVNVPIPVPIAFHSFGGAKRSLFGGNGIYGAEGVKFYTKLKTVTSRWPTGAKDSASFHLPS